jgi:small subunit ribosomal protein S3
MGQKMDPHGLRVGIIKDWDSKWYAGKDKFADYLVEDFKLRKEISKRLSVAGISKVEIERTEKFTKANVYVAKPGLALGKNGEVVNKVREDLKKIFKKDIAVNVIEVKNPDIDATLVAENIAGQIERRISYRKAMKQCMAKALKAGAKGIKTQCGGRLAGAEIARSEFYKDGTIPLQTLRADIDYGFAEANTTYGKIGVKVWIYKGEVLPTKNTEGGRA